VADFDLFNGDADGIFSLLQVRQVEPRPDAIRITGVKRDTQLFKRILKDVRQGDRITALDIGMARNAAALRSVLKTGTEVFFCDHHPTGEVPQSENLTVLMDVSPETCTAFLIDQYLDGAKSAWAICGAYGDNFQALAARIAADRGVNLPLGQLRELGELVNYNAYGLTIEDLHFHPSDLFDRLSLYPVKAIALIGKLQAGHVKYIFLMRVKFCRFRRAPPLTGLVVCLRMLWSMKNLTKLSPCLPTWALVTVTEFLFAPPWSGKHVQRMSLQPLLAAAGGPRQLELIF